MSAPGGPIDGAVDGVQPGKRLIRVDDDRGLSLAERFANRLHRLAWRTPLHSLRLRGRYPLKLLGVPVDPLPGSRRIGEALLAGSIVHRGETAEIETLDFAHPPGSAAFADHLGSFAWLRDLAVAAPRDRTAPIAELMVRRWLAAHGASVTDRGWQPDQLGRRLLFWMAYAPLILSSSDIVYRSAVLNGLARGARHLDGGADKAPLGLPRGDGVGGGDRGRAADPRRRAPAGAWRGRDGARARPGAVPGRRAHQPLARHPA